MAINNTNKDNKKDFMIYSGLYYDESGKSRDDVFSHMAFENFLIKEFKSKSKRTQNKLIRKFKEEYIDNKSAIYLVEDKVKLHKEIEDMVNIKSNYSVYKIEFTDDAVVIFYTMLDSNKKAHISLDFEKCKDLSNARGISKKEYSQAELKELLVNANKNKKPLNKNNTVSKVIDIL